MDLLIVEKVFFFDNLVVFLEVESDIKDIKEVSYLVFIIIKDCM